MEPSKEIHKEHSFLYVGRVRRIEGLIELEVIKDEDTVLIADGDEFITFLTKVEL